jgi:hypothetical protein
VKGDGFDRNVSGVEGKSGGSGGASDVSYWSKADWDKLPLVESKRSVSP